MIRILSVLCVLCLVLFRVAPAEANDEEVVIQLVPTDGVLPQVVCLTARAGKATPRAKFAAPEVVFGDPVTTSDGKTYHWTFKTETETKTASASPAEAEPTPPAVPARTAPGKQPAKPPPPFDDEHALEEARSDLHAAAESDVLFADRQECLPELDLPARQKTGPPRERDLVTCAENVVAGTAARGVAIIDLDYGNTPARDISFFTVRGNLVTVNLLQTDGLTSPVRARVAGGHFRSLYAEMATARGVQLSLEPVCVTREIHLPGVAQGDDALRNVTVSYPVSWATPATVSTSGPTLKVKLPHSDSTGRHELHLAYEVPSESASCGGNAAPAAEASRPPPTPLPDSAPAVGRYVAEWTDPVPPISLPVRVAELQFSWTVPCEYPESVCPVATLTKAGLSSAGTRLGNECQYRVGSKASAFDLPDEVTFSAPDLTEWHDSLSRAGQKLAEYMPAAEHEFLIDMPWIHEARKPGDEIRQVEIVGPTGARRVLAPQATARVTLPFASCKDQLSYQLQGDRDFHWGSVPIENGVLTLDSPGRTASLATLGALLGGGLLHGVGHDTTHPFGDAELAVLFRPKRWGQTGFKSFLTLFDYEFVATLLFTTEPYMPVSTADNGGDQKPASVAYDRIFLSAFALYPIATVLYTGPGIGGGAGDPFFATDQDRVGGVRWFVVPAWRIRYNIAQRLALSATVRGFLPDALYKYEPTAAFDGTPRLTTSALEWVSLELGLQVWF